MPVAFDGATYVNAVPVPAILDDLIARKRIPPMVAVRIVNAPGQRSLELPCSSPFAELLAKEVAP